MRSLKVVIALGGNAIIQTNETGAADEQFRNIKIVARQIVDIIEEGHRVVITHGNGPQSGNLLIQQEEAKKLVPGQPLDVVGAMTQGQIGYMLQQTLFAHLRNAKLDVPVYAIVTQVLVDKNDPDFRNPSKPVGPFYTKEEAEKLAMEKGYVVKKVKPTTGRVYRRVVPSPDPISIIEKEAIRTSFEKGAVLIASGGGGVPVVLNEDGSLKGVEAVIDKDLAGERLAEVVSADAFLILTDVEKVKLNFGKPDQRDLERMSLSEAERYYRDGQFLAGSMGPKVLACMRFLRSGGKTAVITSLDKALQGLKGEAGTKIYED